MKLIVWNLEKIRLTGSHWTNRKSAVGLAIILAAVVLASCSSSEESVTPIAAADTPAVTTTQKITPSSTPAPEPSETPVPTHVPTETATATASATSTGGATVEPISTATATPTLLLNGPLIGFRAHYEADMPIILEILDVGSAMFRIVESKEFTYPFKVKWNENGCLHEMPSGALIDLQGNTVVEGIKYNEEILVPQEGGELGARRLSPDTDWFAYQIEHGEFEEVGMVVLPEFKDIGIINRSNPDEPIFVTDSGDAGPFNWSPDSQWLAYTDVDENLVGQLFRFSVQSKTYQQLTFRDETLATGFRKWSPDGLYISSTIYEQSDDGIHGWVELLNLSDLSRTEIVPMNSRFKGAQKIWWATDGSSFAFSGQVPDEEEQETFQQIYWVDAQNGMIVDSYTANEWPLDSSTSVYAAGGIDQLLFENGKSEFYLLDKETKVLTPLPVDLPNDYYRYDSEEAPFNFPGEENCEYPRESQ